MSEVYVGSIFDVELTKLSGLLEMLENKPGVSFMVDRGFTIKDVLDNVQHPTFSWRPQTVVSKWNGYWEKIASVWTSNQWVEIL